MLYSILIIWRTKTFSILGRIGGDATTASGQTYNLTNNFQYPRSDRRRCNNRRGNGNSKANISFSILGRIGGDATPCPSAAVRPMTSFQYPRSDRRRCNSLSRRW